MIQFPRSFFRQLRIVLRRAFSRPSAPIVIYADPHGLCVRSQQDGIAVEYKTSDHLGSDQFVLPAKALSDLEGKGEELVALEATNPGKVEARWNDAGVPRVAEYEVGKTAPQFPERPVQFSHQDDGLRKALDDAMQSTSDDSVRFALSKIQIRGGSGVIVATDGHALLWQNGFQFPWAEDVLIPRTNIFGTKEFAGPVKIGKTTTHVCVEADPWSIFLLIDKDGRFPRVENVIPTITPNATHLTLTENNAAFLVKAFPRLPGDSDPYAPVTLDLNGQAIVRARGAGQDKSTEVDLVGASVNGKAIRFATDRHFLARALELGFTDADVLGIETPFVFEDARRKYVLLPLGKEHIVAPSSNDVRLSSDSNESSNNHQPAQRRNASMKSSRLPTAPAPVPAPVEANGNGHAHHNGIADDNGHDAASTNGQHQQGTFAALLEETQLIQNGLRDLMTRTNRLMVGLKTYRRHAKTMQSTLASLRQLQQVEA